MPKTETLKAENERPESAKARVLDDAEIERMLAEKEKAEADK